jgi:signal transduction histidine kinase/CheY-like chemotaxis protein
MERLRGSLAAQLLVITAAMSLILAFFMGGIEIWNDRQAGIADDRREANAIVMANLDTMGLAVWSFDDRVLEVTARSLIRSTSITQVEIIPNGARRRVFSRQGAALTTDYVWNVPLFRPKSKEQIGTLQIWENYDDVRNDLRRRAGMLMVVELAKILTTSIALFIVTYLLVARPLRSLARQVQGGENPASAISLRRVLRWGYDEIDALVDAINTSTLLRRQMEAEQRRTEAREANAGKLAALGQLAGGIAHDFNNILGGILGFAGLLRDDLADRPESRRFAERIMRACERGRDMIAQIRTFARAENVPRKPIDLVGIVRQTVNFLAASLPKTLRVSFEHQGEDLPVLGNEALLSQLIINLCLNASEAMAGKTGNLRVSVSPADPAELRRLNVGALSAGEIVVGKIDDAIPCARLGIADDAGGISETLLNRIFEPFFTTKGRQRGTGLGLAVVHGVIESHGGLCHVHSVPGVGTTFSIYLPLDKSPVPEPKVPARDTRMPLGARERVLIVDDEADLADMLSIGLGRLGYDAVATTDPLAALALFEKDPQAWQAVVTDDMMPGMRGRELASRLRALRPEIPILLCTGHSDAGGEQTDMVLLKPVDAAGVAAQLRRLREAAVLP